MFPPTVIKIRFLTHVHGHLARRRTIFAINFNGKGTLVFICLRTIQMITPCDTKTCSTLFFINCERSGTGMGGGDHFSRISRCGWTICARYNSDASDQTTGWIESAVFLPVLGGCYQRHFFKPIVGQWWNHQTSITIVRMTCCSHCIGFFTQRNNINIDCVPNAILWFNVVLATFWFCNQWFHTHCVPSTGITGATPRIISFFCIACCCTTGTLFITSIRVC